ncbi:hypothetical protein [Actinacidiphila oryziradicis]|jgi:hypothetical protein|uniref:hypothetical protein n=1 Tax=Actinacidiphila oryziradicis TaxID=2571141 RepID=UPI0023F08F20|nr:hypothetical protein [Actinacidiphila oryziradicis]MCW2872380.1 hypothetical protein [Actinacidiphila oryziradicis]
MSLGQDGPPTRTRLPETHSGPGGGTRRQPRSSRNLVTVVGVVVVLIAAIAFANRGGGNSSGGGSGSGSGSNSGAGTQAQPTAPTGDKPVTGQAAGIAKGFAKSQQGAQSAAANYAVALGSDGMFRTDRRHTIVAAIHDPAVVGKLQGELDKAYSAAFLKDVGLNSDGSAPKGLTFVSRTVPVGTKVTGYSGSSATVEVWSTALGGLAGQGSTKPVSTTWFTLTEQLAWVNGDWKIESSSQKQGPAPVSGDDQAAGADEIANAVNGYGGFTYAR